MAACNPPTVESYPHGRPNQWRHTPTRRAARRSKGAPRCACATLFLLKQINYFSCVISSFIHNHLFLIVWNCSVVIEMPCTVRYTEPLYAGGVRLLTEQYKTVVRSEDHRVLPPLVVISCESLHGSCRQIVCKLILSHTASVRTPQSVIGP